jgi:hypothetical protein
VSQISQQLEDFQRGARKVARRVHPWIEAFARIGYAAKGIVYCLMGILAILVAIGMRQNIADQRGVMHAILAQPLGRTMLLVMAAGLMCYTLWYFAQAILDPEHSGTSAKGLAKRFGQFCKGVFHVTVVVAIFKLIAGLNVAGSTDASARDWTEFLMAFPAGIWLVAGVGVGFLGYGVWQLYRGWKIKLDDQLRLSTFGPRGRWWINFISRFGLFARGILFGTIGVALIVAAMRANPQEAKGIAAAMRTLEQQPYGTVLLIAVALGVIAYGVYQFVRARYRKIGP